MALKSRTAILLQGQRVSVKNKKIPFAEDFEEAQKWMKQEIKEEGYKLLKMRPRSEKEIRDKLFEKGFLEEEINFLCAQFTEEGWINDAKFTRYFLESYQKSRPLGEYALKQKLREKGVDSLVIEEALCGYFSENNAAEEALNLIRKRFYQYQALPKMEQIKKITAYLFTRGYEYPVIEEVLHALKKEGLIQDSLEY